MCCPGPEPNWRLVLTSAESFLFCFVQAQEAAIGALVEGAPMSAAGQAVVAALEVRSSSRALQASPCLTALAARLPCHCSALSVPALSVPPLGLAFLV